MKLEKPDGKFSQSVVVAPGARVNSAAPVRREEESRSAHSATVKVMAWMYWGQVDVARAVLARAARRVICLRSAVLPVLDA